ncbi:MULTISPECIES: Ppx/GppA phosphatase family protein [Rhizobium/Agrobacterium group]|uniref:Exopolyphosphatase n=2 Tax=Rhizobium/Agrobacterium group TaxID=227290 RepID=B9JSD1_ALLAM|nr:Ppx/GppA phosphatase family protein [Allorhizobium ampelinum]ACM35624.1 exopolyphosphatase [Allorhizobium ampelinum S4]MUO29433.1 Ppx/GppA family phosphatase [Agrobacterium vitis]MUO42608.1 Ppx/GppA family phosphatase [Agrobacterium vitis]MUP10577.1 Ppx/GppA family phosphatase [Agrobacterium vitis]
MVDPGNGGFPPENGASTSNRTEGKPSRRGRGKRKGRKSGPPANPVTQDRTALAEPDRRPIQQDQQAAQQAPGRKRKRRRKGRGNTSPGQGQAVPHQGVETQETVAQAERQAEHHHRDQGSAGHAPREAGLSNTQGPNAQGHHTKESHIQGNALAGETGGAAKKSTRKRRKNRGRQNAQVRPLQPGRSVEAKPASASYCPPAVEGQKSVAGSGEAPHGRSRHGHGGHSHGGHAHGGQGHHPHHGQHKGHHSSHGPSDDHPADFYAALDLGTNNCRLLIAQPTRPGQFRVVDAFSRIVRLGEGLAATGRLSQEAMDRAIEALKVCASKLHGVELRGKRLIATEACRAAENGEAFLERVRAETGLELEIINRETEARLAVSGCSSLVGRETRSVVLFDIGGGSSEIAVIRIGDNRSSRLANHITHWTSLPVGVVTLSERHGGRDVSPTVFEAMITEVSGMLDQFDCPSVEALGHSAADVDFHLIGTSGTVTTLAGVHLDLPRYDRRRVDGLWLSDDEVSAMQAKLLSWDYQSRAANPCIGPDRADLVLAGCAILEAIRRRWPSSRMRVADRGLREGLLTDMMADDGVWRRNRTRRPPSSRDRVPHL